MNALNTLLLALLFVFSANAAEGTPSVESQGTTFKGTIDQNAEAFLGIPYAQAPIKDRRWKAPRRIKLPALVQAQRLPNSCPQIGNMFAAVSSDRFGKPIGNEDCLYLNIWRSPQTSDQIRPVFLWIHGGSNSKGTSADPNYNGAYFALRHNAIFISVNYRLGVFGAFSLEELETGNLLDDSGNYVTLDLIQALKWVKKNIKNFGGDPNNITIAGQSAGCMNVWGLIQTPLAKNLFNKAICSAGLPNAYPKSLVQARSKSLLYDLLKKDGFGDTDKQITNFLKSQNAHFVRNYLRSKTTDEILSIPRNIIPTQHISDGVVFPKIGMTSILLGNYNKVPMILGTTSDEATYLAGVPMLNVNEVELYNLINSNRSDITKEELLSKEKQKKYDNITDGISNSLIYTNAGIAQIIGRHQSHVYVYTFAWQETPAPWNQIFKSFHGLDAIFYLGNFVDSQPSFTKFAWNEENRKSRERVREDFANYLDAFLEGSRPENNKSSRPWHDYSKNNETLVIQ